MMKVWVMQGIHEGELFSSVHMTEKGCALACIADVLEFLGVEDEETALNTMNNNYEYTETDGEQTEPLEWDQSKMKDMKREELWTIFRNWSELTWSNNYGYQLDVMHQEIAA